MKLRLLTQEEWTPLSEQAHLCVFGQTKSVKDERIDFVLLMVSDEGAPLGYGTFRETSGETVHWQYGGVFEKYRGTPETFRGYRMMVDLIRTRYKRMTTYIANDNTVMLKFAMKIGYRIIGVRYLHGKLLVEHSMEFSDAA